MNYPSMIWLSIFSVVIYVITTDPSFPRLLNAIYGKVFVFWKSFLFYMKWNPYLPWSRLHIEYVARSNADANARLLMEELGLPLDD